MTSSNLKQFFISESIPHYFIWYYISSETGKKTPLGEKNNESIEKVNTKKNINPPRPSSYYKKAKEDGYEQVNFTTDEAQSLQKAYTCFLKYTENIYVVDVDMESVNSMDDFILQTNYDFFKDCPYIKGNTKGEKKN